MLDRYLGTSQEYRVVMKDNVALLLMKGLGH